MKNDQFTPLPASHMANDNIIQLIEECGMEGYGIYIALVCELRQRDNYCCQMKSIPALARRWNCPPECLKKVILDFGLFYQEQENGNTFFHSPLLETAMEPLERKRAQLVENGRKGGNKSKTKKEKERSEKDEEQKAEEKPEETFPETITSDKAIEKADGKANKTAIEKAGGKTNETASGKSEEANGKANRKQYSIEENNKAEKSRVTAEDSREKEEQKPEKEKSASPLPSPPFPASWERYIDDAFGQPSWTEVQAMHSGMGTTFMKFLPEITRYFKNHVKTYGKEDNLFSSSDAKNYFSHFARPGTPTHLALKEHLSKLSGNHEGENPYRFEYYDPVRKARSYCGINLPDDAPPRPSQDAVWNDTTLAWE